MRLLAILGYAYACAALSLPAMAQCERTRLDASDAEKYSSYGMAVAVQRDTWVVAAPSKEKVYVYERSPQGELVETLLYAGTPTDRFGETLALDGDRLAVGAHRSHSPAGNSSGKVIVFERDASGWSKVAELQPAGVEDEDYFGKGLALRGDTLLASAAGDDDAAPDAGATYVFERRGGSWVETQKLVASDAGADTWIGEAVALHGDHAAIGARWMDDLDINSGAVWIFERTGGTWTETAKLVASDGGYQDRFGTSLALEGETLVVGAPGHVTGGSLEGHAYVFERVGGAWVETILEIPGGGVDSALGQSVVLSGDLAVIGAGAMNGGQEIGTVHVYRRHGVAWTRSDLFAGEYGEFFGAAVAADQGTVLVGARGAEPAFTGTAAAFRLPAQLTVACVCDAGAPCGNGSPTGGCAGSTGFGAELRACGSASVARDDLILSASPLPQDQHGLVFMGPGSAPAPLRDGLLCVGGGAAYRFPVESTGAGRLAVGPGLAHFAQGQFPPGGHLLPGATWSFQVLYRDPTGPCGTGANLSNAVAITFEP